MLKNRGVSFVLIALVSIGILFMGNGIMNSDAGEAFTGIPDGVYEGTSDAGMHPGLKVAVTIEGGAIVKVEVIEHDETPGISDPAIEGIPLAIVAANSADVDVVSGATLTSNAIIEAVNNALASATGASAGGYPDGVYEGVSDLGMHPGLKVLVTVEGGIIKSVEILEHDETPGISDPALEGVPLAIVDANSPDVDVVSGATMTSEAIMDAVRKALSGEESEEEEEEPVEDPDIASLADGTYIGKSDKGKTPGLEVSVKVEDGKIVDVQILWHDETPDVSAPAREAVPAAIVEANSTIVDVASGATYTSGAIMDAVRNALASEPVLGPVEEAEEAEEEEAETQVEPEAPGQAGPKDGTYEGTSDAGMYPGLKVSVTISGGSITSVEVVEHNETPGISDAAINQLPGAIVGANGTDVDSVSGATMTSAAIKDAVEKALQKAQ